MMKTALLLPALIVAGLQLVAGEDVLFGFHAFEQKTDKSAILPYRLFIPSSAKGDIKYPLIMFFHGAGSIGSDNKAQLGLAKIFADDKSQSQYPCFILAPQCTKGRRWVDTDWTLSEHRLPTITQEMKVALAVMEKVAANYPVDKDRIYVMGQSMGGFAVWDALCRKPDTFAAAVPICGGGDTTQAELIKEIPAWAFHGALDPTVKVSRSREMVAALRKAGGAPRYTEYKDVKHDAWTYAYAEEGLKDWLFQQKRKQK